MISDSETRQVCLLRVGIDTGAGGILGPLFRDGAFEYIPIPEGLGRPGKTYGETKGEKTKRLLSEFFPRSRQADVIRTVVHHDPEFDTFTYGDPTRPKRSLRKLRTGDLLVFYVGLEPYDFQEEKKRGLYIIGYFDVKTAGELNTFSDNDLHRLFANNYHVKHRKDEGNLILIKGSSRSRLLERAQPISKIGLDRGGHNIYVLSDAAKKHLGSFSRLNAIQRSTPRWVSRERTLEAAEWITTLP
jgi:hypothetical protein